MSFLLSSGFFPDFLTSNIHIKYSISSHLRQGLCTFFWSQKLEFLIYLKTSFFIRGRGFNSSYFSFLLHIFRIFYIPEAGASARNQTLKRPPLYLVLGTSTQWDEISARFETLRLGCLKLYDWDCNNGRLATLSKLPGRKTPFPCVQNRPFSYVVHTM